MEIFDQWLVLLEKLDVISTLGAIGIATQKIGHIKKRAKKQQGYYIIKLRFDPVDVEIEPFYGKEKSLEAATQAYSELNFLNMLRVPSMIQSYPILQYQMRISKELSCIRQRLLLQP